MKFCVLSDSHGDFASMEKLLTALQLEIADIQAFLHAGDFAADSDYLRLQTGLPVYAVYGNSDNYRQRQYYKLDEFIPVGDKLIWLTHGHRYLNNYDELELLYEQASILAADVVVYGHTHRAHVDKRKDIFFLNPGSISQPRNSKHSYAILEIKGSDINTSIYEIY